MKLPNKGVAADERVSGQPGEVVAFRARAFAPSTIRCLRRDPRACWRGSIRPELLLALAAERQDVGQTTTHASAYVTNPFAPPGGTDTSTENLAEDGRSAEQRRSKIEMFLVVVLGLVLLPALVLNGLLWLGYVLGLGIYDPAVGGDPLWRARPLIMPALVAATVVARLVLARRQWPVSPRQARAYVVLLSLAILTAAIARIPEPSFFAN